MTAWDWPGTPIGRVVDGDTFDARVTRDIGFEGSVTFPVRLRLNRINAPAANTTDGQAATAALTALIGGAIVDLVTVKHYKYGGPDDTVAEYMAEVTLADGRNVSDEMVREGHAVYWDGQGPRPGDT